MPEMRLDKVVDGFTYNMYFRPWLPNRFYETALGQMDILRRANTLRHRIHCIPESPAFYPIAATENFEMQVRMIPDSYIWGVEVAAFEFETDEETEVDALSGPVSSKDVLVQIVDSCSNIPFFAEHVGGSGLQPVQRRNSNAQGARPMPLVQPRLIPEPGLVNVLINNRLTTTKVYCQVLLYTAEPCESIIECEPLGCM